MVNDLEKMVSYLKTPIVNTEKLWSSVWVTRIAFLGKGRVTNITTSEAEHHRMFLHGVLSSWPTPVTLNRKQKKYPGAK